MCAANTETNLILVFCLRAASKKRGIERDWLNRLCLSVCVRVLFDLNSIQGEVIAQNILLLVCTDVVTLSLSLWITNGRVITAWASEDARSVALLHWEYIYGFG